MDEGKPIEEMLSTLFDAQPFAVLATDDEGQPYVSLMAFAATDDLKGLVFVTERDTRKYANLVRNPRAAALIDNRPSQASDPGQAIAVTALGDMRELDKSQYESAFLEKNAYLEEFVSSPSCVLVEMRVRSYFVARGLQGVTELRP
jgi:nitroimidazol reductase NimA-like FMN-containing flavoprotein (pyridoxamine 5'-phosphate oxidase superfamily)